MNTAIVLAAITALATALGGLLALKAKDRLHLVLGLSAGLLLGLVAFELIPEVFKLDSGEFFGASLASIALLAGFLLLHLYERFFGSHEPAESDYGHEHAHSANVAGGVGAIAMGIHIFIDGLSLAIAFSLDEALGFAVFAALLVHAFSDGLNTVAFLIKNGKWSRKAIWLLGVDSIARIGGAALGTTLSLSENFTAIYLAAFSGIIIYLATSHILPEAHARHSSRWTLLATITGVLVMWGLVSQLHAVHFHSHDEAGISKEGGHNHENDHEDDDHSHETEKDSHDHDHENDDHDHDEDGHDHN